MQLLIEHQVDIVLFGHKHRSEAWFNYEGIKVMLASGKVTEPKGDALQFREIEIGKNGYVGHTVVEIPAYRPLEWRKADDGAVAQLGARLPCTQEDAGSNPASSNIVLQRQE